VLLCPFRLFFLTFLLYPVSFVLQPSGKGSKLLRYVEHRLRVTLDGRSIVGTFLAFDKHLNLVLSEAEEFRTIRKGSGVLEERVEKRSLGLVLIRGENVVSISVEGPPPPSGAAKQTPGGPGVARGAGRGMPPPMMQAQQHQMAPHGLGAGPIAGMGVGVGLPPPPPPPPPPPGMPGMMPPGMGRGMPY
jgi:small nuclear ribonucleoprotein B and B'